jgi:hypothetical protein
MSEDDSRLRNRLALSLIRRGEAEAFVGMDFI